MKATKATYSAAQIEILEGYNGSHNRDLNRAEVERISAEVGKTVPSVRAKLSVMGLYVTPIAPKTSGKGRITKSTKAQIIADASGMNDVERDSLEKSTNQVLDKLIGNLVRPLSDFYAEEDETAEDEESEVESD